MVRHIWHPRDLVSSERRAMGHFHSALSSFIPPFFSLSFLQSSLPSLPSCPHPSQRCSGHGCVSGQQDRGTEMEPPFILSHGDTGADESIPAALKCTYIVSLSWVPEPNASILLLCSSSLRTKLKMRSRHFLHRWPEVRMKNMCSKNCILWPILRNAGRATKHMVMQCPHTQLFVTIHSIHHF